jgi:gag-polypeptide of LTR copia-type
MEDSETVNEFSIKLTMLVAEIRSLGTKLDDSEVVEKLFSSVPDRFLQIIRTIEQFGDIEKMSVSEAIGRLRTFEEGLKGRLHSKGSEEQLLLTQAEWEARCTKGKKDDSSRSAKRGGRHIRGRGRGREYGRGRGNYERTNEDQKPRNFDKSKVKCFNSNEYGHFAKECPKPNRRERANLATTQTEDEPALLMAETCILNHVIQEEHVLLHEDKMIPKVNCTQDKMWYVDTGASNHMTSCIDKFTEIDMTFRGSVKFGDGSTVDIHGRGSVLFECLNGEHRLLTNVYYILMLRSSIISLGQLDQNGCKIVIEGGVMTILDRTQRLLAKVSRSESRLYLLHIPQALLECLLYLLQDMGT